MEGKGTYGNPYLFALAPRPRCVLRQVDTTDTIYFALVARTDRARAALIETIAIPPMFIGLYLSAKMYKELTVQ